MIYNDTIGIVPHEINHTVSNLAIKKSGRVLYAFSEFYLPFYGYKPSDIFWHYDPFAFISAFIYDIDEGVETGQTDSTTKNKIEHLMKYLNTRIDIGPEINTLLDDAHQYYNFERKVVSVGAKYTFKELLKMTSIRSFDFRLMHRVIAQLSSSGYREELFFWFQEFEKLMEIEDDMNSIKEDMQRCTFNFVSLAINQSAETGEQFVLEVKKDIEREIKIRMKHLMESDRKLCIRILKKYRSVVPRPLLTVSFGK